MVFGKWDWNISYLDVNKVVFNKYCFLFTKYVQASHNIVYHNILCSKWHFQTQKCSYYKLCNYRVSFPVFSRSLYWGCFPVLPNLTCLLSHVILLLSDQTITFHTKQLSFSLLKYWPRHKQYWMINLCLF